MEFACGQRCFGSKKLRNQKKIDEIVTPRSITGQHHFPDFDVLDAMIASALKKLTNTQSTFRKRVSVEEQRAQTSDRFLRERQIAYIIYEYFRATRSTVSMTLQNDDVQDFDVMWSTIISE